MLQKLQIKNYAIIDELVVDFSNRLTIITGETGAGKSILLGALSLILGGRSSNNIFFNDKKKCVIEGVFDMRGHGLKSFFKANDLDYEDETIIRREITPSNRSRAFVNDTPIKLTLLNQLTGQLINLHAQHQNLYLNNRGYQLRIVDGIAGQLKDVDAYRKLFGAYVENVQKLQDLKAQNQQLHKDLDYINFQLEELESANLEDSDEQEKLETELKQLENADFIAAVLGEGASVLGSGDDSVIDTLTLVEKKVSKIAGFGQVYEELKDRLSSVLIEINDLQSELEIVGGSVESNPRLLNTIEDRLNMVLRLQNKHQVDSITELQALQEDLLARKESVDIQEKDIVELENLCNKLHKQLLKKAKALSKKRHEAAPILTNKINKLLKQMEMKEARIHINLETSENGGLTSNGLDEVSFLFASNKGSQPVALKKVASGGELSRLMLAIQSLLAESVKLPTLIFDEIDTGISGEVAIKVGRLLQKLSKSHQLICITHLPQIASIGDTHYRVYKEHGKTKTTSHIERLNVEARIVEIGSILSGMPPSKQAMANARQLIDMMND